MVLQWSRQERRHTWLWAVLVLCVYAAVSMASVRSPGAMLAIALLSWVVLLAYLADTARLRANFVWFAPLVVLYFATFRLERWRGTNALTAYFGVFGTDTGRFLKLANRWAVEDRHPGWSLFTFVAQPARSLGERIGLERLGADVLFLQMALFGALAALLVFDWLSTRVASRAVRLLVAYVFASSLVVWVLASAIDTYIVSLFLFLVFLREAREYEAGTRRQPLLIGLVSGTMLAISLENVYVPLLFCLALLVLPRARERRWHELLVYGGTVVAVYGILLLVLHVGAEPSQAGGEPLTAFVAKHAFVSKLLSAKIQVSVLLNETVSAVVAQEHLPMTGYSLTSWHLSWATAPYGVLVAALVALALPAARGRVRWGSWTVLLLGGTLVLRHALMAVWVTLEALVFAGPTVAVLALLLGCGAETLERSGARRRLVAYGVALALLGALLLLHNGRYLFRAELPWR